MAALGRAAYFALAALIASTPAETTQVTPIQKVLQLMNDMVVKATAQKNDEAVKYSAFNQWCGDTTRIKNDEINAGNEKIDMLKATIEKAAALIRELTDRINELAEDVGRWNTDTKSATDVRNKEAADFQATTQDYTESLFALDQAIAVLKKQSHDRTQAELVQSLLQVRSQRMVPSSTKLALTAFLQETQPDVEAMPDDQLFIKAPEANAYEFQSGGVVDMLVKLQDKFKAQKMDLEREELTAQQAFEQIAQQLADNIENAEHEISKKTTLRAETEQKKAEAEGDLAETIKERDDDQQYLDDMTAMCQLKAANFEGRQQLRADELAAIKEAISIIGSQAVAGSGEKHLPTLVQGASSLVQLRGGEVSPLQSRIAAFLAERARLSGSRLLSQVSQQVAENPFGKVKKMIKDLISKLMEEATSETEHKGWCDTELTTNKMTRDKKADEVNTLTNEIEDLTAEIAQLTQDIADLTKAVEELDAKMAEATQNRNDGKATNEATIADSKAGQTAVESAMAVLKDFYAKSAQATVLSQQSPADDAPETFDKPYTGMLPEGGNVVDFLEVILSDFVRLESETAAAEAQMQAEFEKLMFDSKKDKALKENDAKHKAEKKTDQEGALQSAQEELKLTQDGLDKANAYYEKLKPTCVDSGISYEERVKQREAEIQSLQEALKILSGTDVDLN